MEDIKHEKFKMEMFHHLPKQRPLYAVIATILEQSKEKKDAEGAAEEYYRMKVLEDTMIKQKMITAVSIFCKTEIDVRFLRHRHMYLRSLSFFSNSQFGIQF